MKETYERIYTTACYFETPSVLQVDVTEEKKILHLVSHCYANLSLLGVKQEAI